MTIGKKIGLIAIIIALVLVIAFTVLYFYCVITGTATDITMFQITSFIGFLIAITWGTKVYKNYLESKKGE